MALPLTNSTCHFQSQNLIKCEFQLCSSLMSQECYQQKLCSTFQHHERLVKCVIWNLAQIPGKDVTGIRKWICVVNGLLMSQDLPSEVFNMENVLVRFQLTNSIQYLRRWEQGKMTLTPVNGTLSDCYIQTIHPLGMLNTGRLSHFVQRDNSHLLEQSTGSELLFLYFYI